MGSAAVRDPALVDEVAADRAGRRRARPPRRRARRARLDRGAAACTLADALGRFPAAAAFVITDIDRDGLLGGPDVDGLAAVGRRDRRAGDRQRRRRLARRRRAPSPRSTGCTGSSPGGRCTRGASRVADAVEVLAMIVARVDPVPRRHRRPGRQGHQLRRPARRRRSGRAGRPLRRRGRRRARVPRHHGVERRPRHDGRRRLPHGRAGVHPVHGRRRHPHASRTPGGCCAPAPTRSASTPPPSQRPGADRRDRHRVRRPVRRVRDRRQAPRRRRVRGVPARRAHADGHRRRRVGGRRRRRAAPARSCSRRWTATARARASTSS